MRLQTGTILILTLAGFALRLHYLTSSHPFFDEYTTVLASRQILQGGWPVLPSGLFYEHGLLATYLITPFTALFINMPVAAWQPAHWGLMLSRWPSLLLGTATIPLIFAIGRRLTVTNYQLTINMGQVPVALLAAGLFALSPEGMVWGGRARMYALATLLLFVTVWWAFRGSVYPAPAKYRWLAMGMLLATLLTQFGAMLLIPALVVSMLLVGWLSWTMESPARQAGGESGSDEKVKPRVWFLQPTILLEGSALVAVIGFAVFIKRLGRPIGTASLGDSGGNLLSELLNTITYQTAFYFIWPDTIKFLSRQFGVPHHLWLVIAMIAGVAIGLLYRVMHRTDPLALSSLFDGNRDRQRLRCFNLFILLTFTLVILEMLTLLEPFRRNSRYLVMYLPFFYLIAATAIFNIRFLPALISKLKFSIAFAGYQKRFSAPQVQIYLAVIVLSLFTAIGYDDLRIALVTPEPAYEEAFAHIQAVWQADDGLLTMNTPAAALYLNGADGFTIQSDAEQFLLNAATAPVDRWLGAPWLGTTVDFNAALNRRPRTWYVIDTIRQPVYFRGDWQAIVNTQLELVWANDNAMVYRTRADRTPLPAEPDNLLEANLGKTVQLVGYTLQLPPAHQSKSAESASTNDNRLPITSLQLTLFWRPLTSLPVDYTTFLHLRNSEGLTVVQRDGQPLDGAYPTSHWLPGETVIDPITLVLPQDLPADTYTLFTGLYQLDTLERLPVSNDLSGENAISFGQVHLP